MNDIETYKWDKAPKCNPEHCNAVKILFEILHEYFVTSNGQKERDVGHKLWAIISSEFIRPEPTAENMAWAEKIIRERYEVGADVNAPVWRNKKEK